MLTTAANEMLTRIGPGTPMGNLMREYWIPACLSSELKADGEVTSYSISPIARAQGPLRIYR